MPCLAPSELIDPIGAKAFGLVAETFIGKRYLQFTGRQNFFPANPSDFQDISVGFGNVTLFISFIKSHHPNLSLPAIIALTATAGLVRVPDLMTDDATRDVYYEIKPNSIDGRTAGRAKIAALDALFDRFDLPYRGGSSWSPDEKVKVFSGMMFGRNIEGSFHFFRRTPGLILYEICIEGDLLELAFEVIVAIALAIIAIILAGKIPIPGPTPVPVPLLI